MPSVCFVQHFPPSFETVDIYIERPDAVAIKADAIYARGFRLECEVLGSGDISVFISDASSITYAMRISRPGSGTLPASVDALILDFDIEKAVRQRKVIYLSSFPKRKLAS